MGAIKKVGHLKSKTQVRQEYAEKRAHAAAAVAAVGGPHWRNKRLPSRVNPDVDALNINQRRFKNRIRMVKPRKQRTPRWKKPHAQNRRRRNAVVVSERIDNARTVPLPTLVFRRTGSRHVNTDPYVVSAVSIPIYRFTAHMLQNNLIIFHHPDTFTTSSGDRTFKLVAAAQVQRRLWQEFLVVEVRDDLPYRGLI